MKFLSTPGMNWSTKVNNVKNVFGNKMRCFGEPDVGVSSDEYSAH